MENNQNPAAMPSMRLTNGVETFMVTIDAIDELGPAHAFDCRGSGYTRDDMADEPGTWCDDQNTETLTIA